MHVFAFRLPCPVECLSNEMQRIFHRGEVYSSGVSEKQKRDKFSVTSASGGNYKLSNYNTIPYLRIRVLSSGQTSLDNKSQNCYKTKMDTGWTVEFLNDIAEAEFDQLPIEIKAKIVRISQLIEQVGLFSVKEPYVRHVQDKIWEIRARGKEKLARSLYTTVTGKRVVILRTFIKKTRKTPKREIELALQRIKEFDHG